MADQPRNYHIRSKLWIEDDAGNVIFGLGRLRMLLAIDRCGSLNAAAKELKMSYRGLWGKIKATEEGLGASLLHRKIGGDAGGGSQLTDLARQLIDEFREMHTLIVAETDKVYDETISRIIDGGHRAV